MTYSCAIFERPRDDARCETPRRQARSHLPQARPRAGDHRVLEIGAGWGGFALHAAPTTAAASRRRRSRASSSSLPAERVRAAGLDRVTSAALGLSRRCADVRQARLDRDDRGGRGRYLAALSSPPARPAGSRRPDAAAGDPQYRYRGYLRTADLVQRHVFPGGALTSLGAIAQAIGAGTDLSVLHVEDLFAHTTPGPCGCGARPSSIAAMTRVGSATTSATTASAAPARCCSAAAAYLVPAARGRPRRRGGHDHRGPRRRRGAAPRAAGVRRPRRVPVRLLHAGADLLRRRDARRGARGLAEHRHRRPRRRAASPLDEAEIRERMSGNLCRCGAT